MKPRLAKLESPSEKEKLPKLVAIIQEVASAEEIELVQNFLNANPRGINLNELYSNLHALSQNANIVQIIDFIDLKFAQLIDARFKNQDDEESKVHELTRFISEGSKHVATLPAQAFRKREIEVIKKIIQQNDFKSSSLHSLFETVTLEAPNPYNRRIAQFLSPLILNSVASDLKNLARTEPLEIVELAAQEEEGGKKRSLE